MHSRRFGIGLIGVGRHGTRYARHILQDLPTATLAAVCRRHPERPLDVPGAGAVRMYGAAEELIADPSVDALVVVVPPAYTRDVCLQAVRAGKPLLIEKPLAAFAGDARGMAEAAARTGVPLMTAQTLRYDATIRALRDHRDRIGRSQKLLMTSHIETKGRSPHEAEGYGGRGALIEFGVHMLDLVRHLTGEEVSRVQCTMDRVPPAAQELIASVALTTEGGTECLVDIQRVPAQRIGTVVWVGSEGDVSADWITQTIRWTDRAGGSEERVLAPSATVLEALRGFLDTVRGGGPMPITALDGYRAVEVAEACYRSAAAGGKTVRIGL